MAKVLYTTDDHNESDWSIDCPHCGHKHENWQDFIDTDDMSGEFDETCENCGQPYQAKYDTVITFLTKKVDDPEFRQAPTTDELFKTWEKDLGYHKAMLIACGYDISYVVALTETDAEAEIASISE